MLEGEVVRGRLIVRPRNPMTDPLRHAKEPLSRTRRGKAKIEFEPVDVQLIREKFAATQQEPDDWPDEERPQVLKPSAP